jgi:hypothetical protein
MKFELGTGIECDLDILLRSRLLIQAMSGAGKSWLIRRILEQTFPSVQHLVFDSEGDFKTLREEFPYLLVANDGGDIPASAETAGLLAEKLLELSVPAILDISGLPSGDDGGERALFVANFLRGLLDAPQRFWHDALVVLDEAQLFAPQTYNVVSRKTVNDAAGLVRKRGLGLVLATNRLSELHKTASAHLANKLIGCSMGIDADSAARQLGMRRQEATALQTLEEGDFFAFGPSISKQVVRLHVGPVRTTHPSPGGNRSVPTPSTPEQIKSIVAELAALQPPPEDTPDPATPSKQIPCDHQQEIDKLKEQVGHNHDLMRQSNEVVAAMREREEEVKRFQEAFRKFFKDFAPMYQMTRDDDGNENIEQIAPAVDEEAIVQKILARLPADGHTPVQVTPPEALRKKYLNEAVDRTYEKIAAVGDKPRRAMEVLLSNPVFWSTGSITKAVGAGSGGTQMQNWREALKELLALGLVKKGGNGGTEYKADVEGFVRAELSVHSVTDQEVEDVANHVLAKVAAA